MKQTLESPVENILMKLHLTTPSHPVSLDEGVLSPRAAKAQLFEGQMRRRHSRSNRLQRALRQRP